jgi:hypothetical protein
VVDLVSCELDGGQANLVEEVTFAMVVPQQHKSHLRSLDVHLPYFLDLTDRTAFSWLAEGQIAEPLILLIVMLSQVVQYVDSRRYFGRVGDYPDRFHERGVIEG